MHTMERALTQMLEYMRFHKLPFWVVLTKADKLKKSQMEPTLKEFEALCAEYNCKGVSLVSSEKGWGIDELKNLMESFLPQGEE